MHTRARVGGRGKKGRKGLQPLTIRTKNLARPLELLLLVSYVRYCFIFFSSFPVLRYSLVFIGRGLTGGLLILPLLTRPRGLHGLGNSGRERRSVSGEGARRVGSMELFYPGGMLCTYCWRVDLRFQGSGLGMLSGFRRTGVGRR